jgi:hypothetical protein
VKKAEVVYRRLFKHMPEDIVTRRKILELLMLGDSLEASLDRAIEFTKEVIRVLPETASERVVLGRLLEKKGDFHGAYMSYGSCKIMNESLRATNIFKQQDCSVLRMRDFSASTASEDTCAIDGMRRCEQALSAAKLPTPSPEEIVSFTINQTKH